VNIALLDAEARHKRAPFRCVGCGELVVARLGRVRARHFAHRPGSTCPYTNAETALHLEVKERLLELCRAAFLGQTAVCLETRCPQCHRLAPRDLSRQGDGARSEAQAGELRVDVLVTRGGKPALAFEVRVSHPLDPAKEEALARLGLPTLEIDARVPFEKTRPDGVALRVARSLGLSPCPACEEALRAETDRAQGGELAALAELEAYRARGLFGPRLGPLAPGSPGLSGEDRIRLSAGFVCPECGGRALELGRSIARHACPGASYRPVAWRGYDGVLVELAWWKVPAG